MPQLGETVKEGRISTWLRAVGDKVERGDTLFELETDKTSMDVPATMAGVLTAIHVPAGETAAVGTVVAVLTGEGEARPAPSAPAISSARSVQSATAAGGAPTTAPATATASMSAPSTPFDPFHPVRTPERGFGPAVVNGVKTTPLARRLAALAGVDLASVRGSGPHGRIIARDVRNYEAAGPALAGAAATVADADAEAIRALYAGAPHVELPLDAMRRTIARRLIESKQTVPHFYLETDVDIEEMLALRARINAAQLAKISVNDFVVKAFALALREVPDANAVWVHDRILRFEHADIGVAVAIEGGLITPVLRAVETRSLSALSEEIRDLADRARDRKLMPREYQGGAATVSNLGMYGVRAFSAIINPPHATILAVGAASRRPVETADSGVRFTSQITATLSCDHRVVDGATGARLLTAFKAILEEPLRVLL